MSTQLFQATFFTSPSTPSNITTTSVSSERGGGGGTEQYQELAQIDVNFNLLLLQRVLSHHTTSNTSSNTSNNNCSTYTSSSSSSSPSYKASVDYPTCLLDIFTKIRSLSYTSMYAFLYDLAALRHDLVTIINTYTTTSTHTSTSSTRLHTSSSLGISHTNSDSNNNMSNNSMNSNNDSNSVFTDHILSAFDTVTAVGMNYLIVHKLELYQLHIAIYKEEEEAKGEGHMGVPRFNITTTANTTTAASKRPTNSTSTAANTDTNGNIISNSNIDTGSSSGSGGLFSIDSDTPSAPILPAPATTTPATTTVTSDTITPVAPPTDVAADVAGVGKDTNTKHTKNTTVKTAKKKRKTPPIHDPPPDVTHITPSPSTTTDNGNNNTNNSVDDSSVNVKRSNKNTTATSTCGGSVDTNSDICTTHNTNNTNTISNGKHILNSMLVDEPTHTTTNNTIDNNNNNNNTSSNNTTHNSSSNNSNTNNNIHPCITDPKYITSRFMHMWRVSCEHRFFNHILAQTMNGYGESSYSKLANPVHAARNNGHDGHSNRRSSSDGMNGIIDNGKLTNPVPLYLSSHTSNYHSKMNTSHLFVTNRSLIGWSAYITQGVKDDILYEQKDLLTHMGCKEYLSQQQAAAMLAYNVPIESQISDQDVVNTMLTLSSCSRSALPAEPTVHVNYWSAPTTNGTTPPVQEYGVGSSLDGGNGDSMLNETVTLLEDQYGAPTLPWNKAYHTKSSTPTTPTTASRADRAVRHTSHAHEDPGGEMDGEREEGESEEGHNYDPTPDYLRQDETLLMLDRYCDNYMITYYMITSVILHYICSMPCSHVHPRISSCILSFICVCRMRDLTTKTLHLQAKLRREYELSQREIRDSGTGAGGTLSLG